MGRMTLMLRARSASAKDELAWPARMNCTWAFVLLHGDNVGVTKTEDAQEACLDGIRVGKIPLKGQYGQQHKLQWCGTEIVCYKKLLKINLNCSTDAFQQFVSRC